MIGTVSLRAGIPPFYVMDVWLAAAERQRTHGDLVNLSAGQPSAGAPAAVRTAAKAALDNTVLGYTVALGIPELRAAIAGSYQSRHGLTVDPNDVVVTTGSSGGFLLSFLACFDVGDRVAIGSPGYPCYRNILSALGCEVVEMPCGPDTRFQPTAQMLAELDPPVQGVIVASPANPTGSVLGAAELAALAAECRRRGTRFISDEIYHGIAYAGQCTSALQVEPDALVINSFSKLFRMPGWRIGWLVAPEWGVAQLHSHLINFFLTPPAIAQHAALAAFDDLALLRRSVDTYAANRARLLEALPTMGLAGMAPPEGAFYLYVDVSHLTSDSLAFCKELLDDTGIAIAPGIDFDPVHGSGFVRLSFAISEREVERAIALLGPWLDSRAR